MLLAISALILVIPHQLWKVGNGGLIKKFAKDENMKINAENSDDSRFVMRSNFFQYFEYVSFKTLFRYIAQKYATFFHSRRGKYNMHFIKFVLYEIGNLIAIVIVFVLTDKVLAGNFQDYGREVYDYYTKDPVVGDSHHNPMCNVFPTLVRIYRIK